jgi:hypothetical protein
MQAQVEVARLSAALEKESQIRAQAEQRAHKYGDMYTSLKRKYTSLKRSIQELPAENEEILRSICANSPISPDPTMASPDAERTLGKKHRAAESAAAAPPSDTLVPAHSKCATPVECTPTCAKTPDARCTETAQLASKSSSPPPTDCTPGSNLEPAESSSSSSSSSSSADPPRAHSANSTVSDALSPASEERELAVTLTGGQQSSAATIPADTTDDEAASLALAMQMMQQEQALAQIYGEVGGGGFGFVDQYDADALGQDWIPNEEVEVLEADDALAEDEATYEQLVELDEQRVVVGISDEGRARTTVKTLSDEDVAAMAPLDLHSKRCCICLCDYEAGEQLRVLPCKHRCHMDCMDTHLAQSKACPECRTEV